MSNFDEEKENNDSLGIDLTRQVSFNSTPVSGSNKPPVWAWFGLATLILIALLVIFVLPTVVSEYQLPLEPRVDTLQIQPAIPIDSVQKFLLLNKLSKLGNERRRRMSLLNS